MLVREPVAGTVKTRLASALGAGGAADLYHAFVEDACARLAPRVPLMLACASAPGAASGVIARVARRHRVPVMAQGDGDLGARMRRIAATALATAPAVVLLGSDAPTLPVEHVTAALGALGGRGRARARVVLGPSLDGGYHLLGLRAPLPDVFRAMPWSTDRVLARTLARLRRTRVTPVVLPCWYDVDTPADLDLLARHLGVLAAVGDERCPRTRRVLARLRPRPGVAGAARRAPAAISVP